MDIEVTQPSGFDDRARFVVVNLDENEISLIGNNRFTFGIPKIEGIRFRIENEFSTPSTIDHSDSYEGFFGEFKCGIWQAIFQINDGKNGWGCSLKEIKSKLQRSIEVSLENYRGT